MKLTKIDPFTGIENTRDLPITEYAYDRYIHGGKMIQDEFPNLSPDDREFIMTGIMPGSWDAAFVEDIEWDEGGEYVYDEF